MRDNFWKYSFLLWLLPGIVSYFVFTAYANADEPELNLGAVGVGAGMLIVPSVFTGPGTSWGHAIELSGFSYAGTDIGERVLPEKYWFISPIFVGLCDLLYRAGENTPTGWRELGCDLTGVLGRVSINVLQF